MKKKKTFTLEELIWLKMALRNLINDAIAINGNVILLDNQLEEVYALSNKIYGMYADEIIKREGAK